MSADSGQDKKYKPTGGDFLRLGAFLSSARSLLDLPGALLARGVTCPNCGPNGVPLVSQRLPGGSGRTLACPKCGFRATEYSDGIGA